MKYGQKTTIVIYIYIWLHTKISAARAMYCITHRKTGRPWWPVFGRDGPPMCPSPMKVFCRPSTHYWMWCHSILTMAFTMRYTRTYTNREEAGVVSEFCRSPFSILFYHFNMFKKHTYFSVSYILNDVMYGIEITEAFKWKSIQTNACSNKDNYRTL